MRYLLLILLLLSIFPAVGTAGNGGPPLHHYYLDPGITVSYTFGEHSGFSWGVELSFIRTGPDSRHPSYGMTGSYTFLPAGNRAHLGLEYLSPFVGIDIGPSYYVTEGAGEFGVSIIPFAGIFVIPFYHMTFLNNGTVLEDAGLFAKLPIHLDHYRYNWLNSD